MDHDAEQIERAAARRRWPVSVYRLGQEPPEDLSDVTTAAERLAMMWPLAKEAFALAGHSVAPVPRSEMPVVVRRLGDPASGDPTGQRPRP